MTRSISQTIVDVCKKQGIDYTSINPDYKQFMGDAVRIGEIVKIIQGAIDELDCIFSRHKVNNKVKKDIEDYFKRLHELDHAIIKLAYQIKDKKI